MPRCDGCTSRCSCVIVDGDNTTVLGTGSKGDPYRVNADVAGESGRFPGEIVAFGGGTAPTGWLLANGQAVSRATYSALFAVIGTVYGNGDGAASFNLPDLAGRFPLGADADHLRGSIGGVETITLTQANLPAHVHTIAHQHDMAHSHDMAHGHDMSHGHGNVTANGDHRHTVAQSNDDGSNNGTFRRGAQADRQVNTSQDGNHVHTVPAFSGGTSGDSRGGATGFDSRGGVTGASSAPNSGSVGSGQAHTNMPPYTSVTYLIKS